MHSWCLHTRSSVSSIEIAGDQMNRDKRKHFFTRAGGRIVDTKTHAHSRLTYELNYWTTDIQKGLV